MRQRLGQDAEPPLALAQRLLGPLVLGDVPGQGHREPASTLPERSAPDLDREHRPVVPPVAGFKHEHLPGVQPPPELLEHGGGDVGVEVERGHPHQLVPRVPQALARLAIHVDDDKLVVLQEEGVGGMVHERPEPLLAGPQRLLRPLQVGDIDAAADEANRPARRVAHGHAPREPPAVRAILVPGPKLNFELPGFAGQVGSNGVSQPLAVIGMYHHDHRGCNLGRQLGATVAQELPVASIGHAAVLEDAVGDVDFPGAGSRAAQRQLQAGVGLAQLLLQPFAFGDVLQDGDDISGPTRRVAPERDGHVGPDQ